MARLPLSDSSRPGRPLRTKKMRLSWLLLPVLACVWCGCSGIVYNTKSGGGSPDFSFLLSSSALSLTAGGSAESLTLTATAIDGFTGTINVTVSGLPTGVTTSPATLTLTPGTPLQVNFTAASSAAAGTSTVQFTGTSGTLSHSASFSLIVTAAPANPDFSLSVNVTSLSVTAGGSAQPVSVSATALNGFTGTINVALSGLPAGVTASPASFTLTPGTPQQVEFTASSSAAAGSSTVQFTGTSGTLSHSASFTLMVSAAVGNPDFSLSVNLTSLSVTAGGSAQPVSVSATALNGFTGTISVTISGLPTGVTASPASFTLTPGTPQQVNFTASSSAAAGSSTVEFTGTSGTLSHSASFTLIVSAAGPSVDIVTYHVDVGRTGLNANETTLTLTNVNSSSFGLIRTFAGDDQVNGEPLYLTGLTVGGTAQNVVYFATESDSVYAYNADTGTLLWKTSVLETGETPSGDHGCGQISPNIGITTTPVIDRSDGPNGAIFVVGMSLDSSGNYHQRLHALDITTGAELTGSPTEITATYPGTGDNSSNGTVVFDPSQYAERAGLLLLNGTLYMGFTSHCDGGPYTGWLMGYNELTLKQSAVLNLTPNGSEGSIWMAGAGLAADANSYIYFLDANGTFDTTLNASGFPSQSDYGNGFIKVSTANGTLAVTDYFEMSNTVSESNNDEDLGSGGALVLPDMTDNSGTVHYLAVGAGKDGNIYVVNRDNMGKFNANNDSAIYQELDNVLGGVWAMPAYFNNTVYYADVGGTLKAFPITNAMLATTPQYQSTATFTYPGATPSVSANGTTNGIVWAVANNSNAVLYAFNAATLAELYDSTQAAGGRDNFGGGNKFVTPTIVNGKVFVGTPSGVAEFGLLQ